MRPNQVHVGVSVRMKQEKKAKGEVLKAGAVFRIDKTSSQDPSYFYIAVNNKYIRLNVEEVDRT